MSKLIAFGWYGGKFSHLDWLLPLLPKTTHYCEPFGGSAAVLLNRETSPVETYNDIDGELVNFFQVLRNQSNSLIRAIGLTPFSRREFEIAISQNPETLSDLERARRFFVIARQVRTGLAQTASSGRWAHCLLTSRAGMAGAVSRWLGSVEGLSAIVQRLLRVQIENCSAFEIIERYDSEETLFYCDPPYPHDSRGDTKAYAYEMTDEEHRKLAYILHNVKGKVAVSGYHGTLMDELYRDWQCIEAPSKQCHSTKGIRTEVLWINYPLKEPYLFKTQLNKATRNKLQRKVIMSNPKDLLERAHDIANNYIKNSETIINDPEITDRIEFVCRNPQNRAGARLLLACSLAKNHQHHLDIRKPYTEIGGTDCYSGRAYDENYITGFINDYELPCNPTTAFLTPALRNRNTILTPELNLVGKPPKLYKTVLELLADIHIDKVSAEDVLAETIRWLIIVRDEKRQRLQSLIADLNTLDEEAIPLSAEAIIKLIEQHIQCKNASRLPVLVVAAVYQSASAYIGERHLPLERHNAADRQTGSLGDIEITLINEVDIVTCYEMKMKKVTIDDINRALQKVNSLSKITNKKIDNYIFITTDIIADDVKEYTACLYEQTNGIEFVVLDCVGFLRHFLHLFHRLRIQFLEAYQKLVLREPESAVSPALKEAFLSLRRVAESE